MKNPSSNNVAIDIPIELNVIKCRYPNCQPPAQPGLELPAVSRPSTALYWSNDSHWSFTVDGINVVGKNELDCSKSLRINFILFQ